MKRKHVISIFGIATLIVLAYIIYKIFAGVDIEFLEIMAMGVFSMIFLYASTWGNKKEKNGIFQDEELGQRIVEKSSKVSYTILYFVILATVLADKIVNEASNVFLLFVLVFATVIFPLFQYLIAKRYQ